ncbi:MAG: outer membrane protein assembly factor BamB family protein [Planctomycetota bacterium]
MKTKVLSVILCLISLSLSSAMADWPQYLGPDRNGISPETSLASSWPEQGPKVLWKSPVGEGFAGVSIKDGKVYLVDRVDSEKDVIRCYDFESGEELWSYSNEDPGKFDYNGSRNPPTVDDENLYCLGAMGTFYCISLESHDAVWKYDFKKEYGAKTPIWGFSQSPVLYKNMVIVAPQTKEAGVVAYDKDTGKIVWKTPRICAEAGYSSPTLTTIKDIDQIVIVTPLNAEDMVEAEEADYGDDEEEEEDEDEEDEDEEEEEEEDEDEEEEDEGPPFEEGGVYGINAETGEVLWNYRNFTRYTSITPVTVIGDDRLLITGEGGSTMLKIRLKGSEFEAAVLFKNKEYGTKLHPAMLYEDHLYMISEENDGLVCVTLGGKLLWKSGRYPRLGLGGAIMADGKIYMVEGDRGNLCFAEANPEKYVQLGMVEDIMEGDQMWAPPAIADGKLVIRDQKQLICLEVK